MDAHHFDRLTRALSEAGTRRGLLTLLAPLPVLGGLFALFDHKETDAKGRRKRRKKRHKHGKGRHKKKHKKHKKKCKPQSRTTTCAGGKCGPVVNNCKKTIDCGSCACNPPCDECFTCQGAVGAPGTCVPEAAGTPCGGAAFCSDGTLFPQGSCDGDGNCLSSLEVPCEPYQCVGNACATTCANDDDCFDGYFCDDADHCVAVLPGGDPCAEDGQCQSGFCVTEVCCQTACNGSCEVCDASGDGTCTTEEDGSICGSDAICCAGSCESGVCCANTDCLSEEAPDCVGHDCVCATNSNEPCDDGLTCCDDGCFNLQSDPQNCGACGEECSGDQTCQGGVCGEVCGSDFCPAPDEICCNGSCCDGCCGADGSCGACLVFVSSSLSNGNLGGLAGADQTCQTLAENATPAPLPGEYKAWLSINNNRNQSPANGRFHRSGQPYRLVNGAQIAANWAELTDGSLAAAISLTELGQGTSDTVWTSTRPDGSFGTQSGGTSNCVGWQSADSVRSGGVGRADQSDADWTIEAGGECSFGSRRLYCFQQR